MSTLTPDTCSYAPICKVKERAHGCRLCIVTKDDSDFHRDHPFGRTWEDLERMQGQKIKGWRIGEDYGRKDRVYY